MNQSAYSQAGDSLTLDEVLARYHDGPQTGIFTDGGARPNPGPGGWGLVWVQDGQVLERHYGKSPDTTNNRMELTALIEAYTKAQKWAQKWANKPVPQDQQLTVYTDSQLCVNTLTQWAAGWKKNGWKRKSGPIKNLELVQDLYALYLESPKVEIKWVKAHNGWLWNEYADSLASAWTRSEL